MTAWLVEETANITKSCHRGISTGEERKGGARDEDNGVAS